MYFMQHKNIFASFIIYENWNATSGWISSLWKVTVNLYCILDIMFADGLKSFCNIFTNMKYIFATLTTYGIVCDDNFVKTIIFHFQCADTQQPFRFVELQRQMFVWNMIIWSTANWKFPSDTVFLGGSQQVVFRINKTLHVGTLQTTLLEFLSLILLWILLNFIP